MGGGTHTKQNNVPKNPKSYSSDEAAVSAGSGGGFDKAAAGACLITFKAKLTLVSGVGVGTKFMLIPGAEGGGLQLLAGSRRIGTYAGDRLELLKGCIAGGYTYEGVVDKVRAVASSVVADCTIKGSGPV